VPLAAGALAILALLVTLINFRQRGDAELAAVAN
jgi:DHA1 family inner membrane transport protein